MSQVKATKMFCLAMLTITLTVFVVGSYGISRMAHGELDPSHFNGLYILTMIGFAGTAFFLHFIVELRGKQ